MDNDDVDEFAVGMNVVMVLLESTEDEQERKTQRGPRPVKRPNIERFHGKFASRLDRQYLGSKPLYEAETFRRRYRVPHEIYNKVHDAFLGHDSNFVEKQNCTGKAGIASKAKMTAAFRDIAYGLSPDAIDKYLSMSETT